MSQMYREAEESESYWIWNDRGYHRLQIYLTMNNQFANIKQISISQQNLYKS